MGANQEGRKVFLRFCLIGFGIPLVLLAFVLALYYLPWSIERARVSETTLNVAAACVAVLGMAFWAFFGQFLYRRLWRVFAHIADSERAWSYAEGVFGLMGVGVSMPSVLGVLFLLFTGDFSRSLALVGLSFLLAAGESFRFPGRIAEVERTIMGLRDGTSA